MARSDLPGAATIAAGLRFESWEAALTNLGSSAAAAPATPIVVVLDEFPYLLEQEPALEATIQKVYDRLLRRVPMLLILVGSDLSMMAALTEYGRPLFGRQSELVVHPLTPAETADLLGLDPADALDAYLVVGGLPLVVQRWRKGESLWSFLEQEVGSPTSPLIVSGERTLAAEFPSEAQAREVLGIIGAGETTFTAIAQGAGIPQKSLTRSLELLVKRKRVAAAVRPLSC